MTASREAADPADSAVRATRSPSRSRAGGEAHCIGSACTHPARAAWAKKRVTDCRKRFAVAAERPAPPGLRAASLYRRSGMTWYRTSTSSTSSPVTSSSTRAGPASRANSRTSRS
ncbi:hypothetical protein [Cellulosimicrobium sp. CUA-896]|uniref:hypothetical protein n=1 Tax=Cellulosimicrobium sp. CUA-896 TaxID=1517881 RepID=UPI002101C6D6|nr:hypothetical protein [Cellulosimicrobium sp. CUA-896]